VVPSSRSIRALSSVPLLVALLVAPSLAGGEVALGGPGESCRARSDCEEPLRCIEQTCVEPETTPEPEADAESSEATEGGGTRWLDFELGGIHPFFGITVAPGMTGYWQNWGNLPVESAFLFALRAGVLFDTTELSVELAPATWVWRSGEKPMLTLNVAIGGLLRLTRNLYWPLRFGLGFAAVNTPTDEVYMQGRLELVGLAYQLGHVIIEMSLPSIRFSSEFEHIGIWAWLFNVSFSYVI